jgi:hypothetical protein
MDWSRRASASHNPLQANFLTRPDWRQRRQNVCSSRLCTLNGQRPILATQACLNSDQRRKTPYVFIGQFVNPYARQRCAQSGQYGTLHWRWNAKLMTNTGTCRNNRQYDWWYRQQGKTSGVRACGNPTEPGRDIANL